MLINIINMMLIVLLLLCSAIDIKRKEIPASMLVVLGITTILFFFGSAKGAWGGNICVFAKGMIPGILLLAAAKVSKEHIGCGDGIVLMGIGSVVGAGKCMLIFAMALVMAGIFAFGIIVVRRVSKNYKIPFVPFLTMAYLLGLIPSNIL